MENYIVLNPPERYAYIINQEVERNGFKFKLKQFLLDIFCCCFRKDPDIQRLKEHRIYLKQYRPDVDAANYAEWELAARKINRMLPFYKEINLYRHNRPVHVHHVQPPVNNFIADRGVVFQDMHRPHAPKVYVDANPEYHPVNNMAVREGKYNPGPRAGNIFGQLFDFAQPKAQRQVVRERPVNVNPMNNHRVVVQPAAKERPANINPMNNHRGVVQPAAKGRPNNVRAFPLG